MVRNGGDSESAAGGNLGDDLRLTDQVIPIILVQTSKIYSYRFYSDSHPLAPDLLINKLVIIYQVGFKRVSFAGRHSAVHIQSLSISTSSLL